MKFDKVGKTLNIALDISASDIGVAAFVSGQAVSYYEHFTTEKDGDYMRLLNTADKIIGTLQDGFGKETYELRRYENVKVFPEQVFIGKNGFGMITPLIMHGVLLTRLNDWAENQSDYFYWNEIGVNTWRSWLLKAADVTAKLVPNKKTGKMQPSRKSKDLKEATKLALMTNRFGYEYIENTNTADALSLALYVKEHNL